VPFLLDRLSDFTGPDWEQEDDVTMVLLDRSRAATEGDGSGDGLAIPGPLRAAQPAGQRAPGHAAGGRGGRAAGLLPQAKLERLKTAVAEATMNGMEHGNKFDEAIPVLIEVARDGRNLTVSITDRGLRQPIPEAETPDLTAKLAGQQSPRGWGLVPHPEYGR
jgi:hypothetical protein